jgi:hypothetical protein
MMCRIHHTFFVSFSFWPQFASDDGEGGLPKMAFNNLSSAHMGKIVHTVYD